VKAGFSLFLLPYLGRHVSSTSLAVDAACAHAHLCLRAQAIAMDLKAKRLVLQAIL